MIQPDEHFRSFVTTLEGVITGHGDNNSTARQKAQVENLVGLEKKFRRSLIRHRWGKYVYRDFIHFIMDEKRNILEARPYFRERNTVFTSKISDTLRKRNYRGLYRFHFNFQFISFVVKIRHWWPGSPILQLYEQIVAARSELIEMNLPLAISQARMFWSKMQKSHLEYMDFIQIAGEGLIAAIDKFCLPYTTVFRTVASHRMKGNFIDSVQHDTILLADSKNPKEIKDFRGGDHILGINDEGGTIQTKVIALHDHGMVEGYEVTFDDGYMIVCSADHKFLTKNGMVPLRGIVSQNLEVLCERETAAKRRMDSPLWIKSEKPEDLARPQEGVRNLPSDSVREKASSSSDCSHRPYPARGMGLSLRTEVSEKEAVVQSQEELSSVQGRSFSFEERKYGQVEGRESRSDGRQYAPKFTKGLGIAEKSVQNGSLAKEQRDVDMERCQNKLRKRTETSGFCVSRQQDLGRSGRRISFLGNVSDIESQTSQYPEERRNAEERGNRPTGCDADPTESNLFRSEYRRIKKAMVGLAYSDAPLSSIGDLLCRRVVRVSPVGPRRMYDLEVDHPKHNFLLPNGIVTSNSYSETVLHFYPKDRRRLYQAYKFIKAQKGREYSMDALVVYVNKQLKPNERTNPTEMVSLLGSASVVSGNSMPVQEEPEGGPTQTILEKYAAPQSQRPDIQNEEAEAKHALSESLSKLTIFERKLLRMKGIDL